MISLDECRALLGDAAAGKSDEELAAIRQSLYDYAHVVLKVVRSHGAREQAPVADRIEIVGKRTAG